MTPADALERGDGPPDCPRRSGWLTGVKPCRFEPRYDERPADLRITDARGYSADALRELMVLRVYVRDVCVRCGRTIERVKAP